MEALATIDWFSLPSTILATIFSQWLSLRDISSLDIATSEKEKRTTLLALFASAEFVHEGRKEFFQGRREFFPTYSKIQLFNDDRFYKEHKERWKTYPQGFVPWILIRKISIRNLKTSTLQFKRLHTEVNLDKLQSLRLIENNDISGIEDIHLLCSNLQSFTISESSRNLTSEKYMYHLSKLTNLRSLKLQVSNVISDIDIRFLSMGCRLLENLDLFLFTKITVRTIKHLAKYCRQLKSLYLTSCFEKFEYSCLTDVTKFCHFPEDAGFPMLTDLDLSSSHFHDVWLTFPVTKNYYPSLTSLNLDRCIGLKDSSLAELSSHCPMLKILYLRRFEFRGYGLEYISGCRELQELYLQDCLHLPLWANQNPHHNPSLHLLYQGCTKLTTLSLQYSNREKIFHRFLCYNHQFVTDESLQVLSDNCTQLTALDLSGCQRITDAGLNSLSKCQMLRRLNLDGCNEITGNGLFSLSLGCKNLEILSLASCAIVDDALQYLVYPPTGNGSTLQKLDLHDSYVSAEGILALGRCTQLRTLNLSDSPNIDNNCLQCLSEHCSMLEHLNLNNCEQVTNKGIKKLSEGCHQLKSIQLQKCNISIKSIQHLSKGCRLLENLDISNSGKITIDQIRKSDLLIKGLTITIT